MVVVLIINLLTSLINQSIDFFVVKTYKELYSFFSYYKFFLEIENIFVDFTSYFKLYNLYFLKYKYILLKSSYFLIKKNQVFSKILGIEKVSKTRKKGRIKKFKIILSIGNKTGWVGFGSGKSEILVDAYEKAIKNSLKNIFYFDLNKNKFRNLKIIEKFKTTKVELNSTYKNYKIGVKSESGQILFDIIGVNNIKCIILKKSKTKLNFLRTLLLSLLTYFK